MVKCLLIFLAAIIFSSCQNVHSEGLENMQHFAQDSKVVDVIDYKNFGNYGRLIFPVDRQINKKLTLKNLDEIYIWYSCINPAKTVEIVNYFKEKADAGEKIFYDIYTDAEKKSDPHKKIPACFSLKANRMPKLQFVTRAAVFTTSAQCTTVFRTRSKFPKKVTTPLL